MKKTLVEEMQEIDKALWDGTATQYQEERGLELIDLFNNSEKMMKILKGLLNHSVLDEGLRPFQANWIVKARKLISELEGK